MKIGKNDLCICGSGKKYKNCCQCKRGSSQNNHQNDQQEYKKPLFSIQTLEGIPTLAANDDIAPPKTLQHQQHQDEFCGLSPNKMYRLLYFPFESPDIAKFSTSCNPPTNTMVLKLFLALTNAIGKNGLKTTTRGNLPVDFCKHIAQETLSTHSNKSSIHNQYIQTESDVDALHSTRLLAELTGLIKKSRGKFIQTQKCQELLKNQSIGKIYFELFHGYTQQFNWSYRDGYNNADVIQTSFLFSLYLLQKYGHFEQSQKIYEDKFLTAFPVVVDMFAKTVCNTPTSEARACYFLRTFKHFAYFFGFLELKPYLNNTYQRNYEQKKYLVKKSLLLDSFITFN